MIDYTKDLNVCNLVVFTGGEPLILGKDLYHAIQYANQEGFLTRVVTNAYWASSKERSYKVLSNLKECGLSEINFSCDDFHQEFIPIKNIKCANEAAIQLDFPALIVTKGIKGSKITKEYLEEYLGTNLAIFDPNKNNPRNNLITCGLTVPVGWDSEKLTKEDLEYSENPDIWKIPCDDILKQIVITPEGKLAACCGCGSEGIPELVIGNVHSKSLLDLIEEGNYDFIWNWLALEGPYGIMEFLKRKDPSLSFEERYVNKCHLCNTIFSNKIMRNLLKQEIETAYNHVCLLRAWLELKREQVQLD